MNLFSEKLVSKFAFKFNLYRYILNCVLDKATLDTMCQLDDEPNSHGSHASKMLSETCRVLRPGGAVLYKLFMQLTRSF